MTALAPPITPSTTPDATGAERVDRHEGVRAGDGFVELTRVAGRTAVTRARASSPLKLLTPKNNGRGAWVFTSTYGGGLVGGDEVTLKVSAGEGTTCFLGTQSCTKVYRPRLPGLACRQTLDAFVDEAAVLIVAPDPVMCFAGSTFVQRQRFNLAAGASLALVDAVSSGRSANGERWAFDRYETRNDVYIDGLLVARDAIRLALAPLARRRRPVGRDSAAGVEHAAGIDCLATVLFIGPAFEACAAEALNVVASHTIRARHRERCASPPEAIAFAASPLRGRPGR